MTYALPTNITSWSGLAVYMGDVTNGLFWVVMLGVISMIVWFMVYRSSYYNPSAAFMGAGWVFFIGSLLLNIIGAISGSYILIGAVVVSVSTLFMWMGKDRT